MKHLCLVMSSFIENKEENVIKSSNPLFVDDYETALELVSEWNNQEKDKKYRHIYWIEFIEDFRKGAK